MGARGNETGKDAMAEENQKITVRTSGPYLVRVAIPLVRKSLVMSEHDGPPDWSDAGVNIDTAPY